MLEALISSRARVKLLSLFLQNPGKEYFVREIVRMTGENINAVRRELANLASFGLITGRKRGNQQYYEVNTGHFLYADLQKVILKTEGVAGVLAQALAGEKAITCSFIYGSFAKGTAGSGSDIDLFIIGDADEARLIPLIAECENTTGREINFTLMTGAELVDRKKAGDPFVTHVMQEEKILITGTCDDR